MTERMRIDKCSVSNFRSILHCEVDLSALTFFVGANSSGKTTFFEALAFVTSTLSGSLKQAINDRRGVHSILHHPVTFPSRSEFNFSISSSDGLKSRYELTILFQVSGEAVVEREYCKIETLDGQLDSYLIENGILTASIKDVPSVDQEKVFLQSVSSVVPFKKIHDFLSQISRTEPATTDLYEFSRRIHDSARNMNKATREIKKQKGETFPEPVERGLTAHVKRLQENHPDRLDLVYQYLRAIAPPFDRMEIREVNDYLWLRFVDKFSSGHSGSFDMASVSSGLINSAEILLNLFDQKEDGEPMPPVLIEEPEALLHPGAIHVLRDSLVEASESRQVLVTSHSPELLEEVSADLIRCVYRNEDGTHIEPLDDATKSILRDRLYTPGEMLRQGGLTRRTE
jgi:predicted ATPase